MKRHKVNVANLRPKLSKSQKIDLPFSRLNDFCLDIAGFGLEQAM